ncbi:competence damage-inducible protein A [Candidatus Bathyarchaeota archaeon]|nr:MAG: competence damage-inducible protein A [Candidatus Bathyarchaeota archaeon]
MSEGNNVEIICVGNELLIGKTVNTNAHWLAKRITVLGMKVRRITVVGDDLDEIASAVREAISRKPRFIITTGGLGPTFDDKTLEGVALGLNLRLEENEEAMRMIREKYERYYAEGRINSCEMTPHRVKMGRLPEGAKPLPNPVGTAPGVLLEHENIKMIMLPGVPEEMKSIFDESVAPMIREASGNLTFYEASLDVRNLPESELAPMLDVVMHDNPYVYIKSHPKRSEGTSHLELHFSTTSDDSKVAKKRIERAILQLSEMIKKKGGAITPVKD